MTDKKNLPFFIFALAVFIALLLPSLVQDGMFMDGLIYATVAKNFSHGMGTWWNLHLNNSLLASYHDQPPLTLWIESFFFFIFGDSIYTERIYSFFTACISGWLVMLIWKQVYYDQPELKKISWLPLLFWIVPPVCFWTYANNMQECTMSIFILLSVWCILKGFIPKEKNTILFLTAGGICIFLSSMCKGIQGMFPLALPAIFWLLYRKFSFGKMLLYSLILITVPAIIYFLLFQNEVIADSFRAYFQARLFNTFNVPATATTESRLHILQRLLTELLLPLLICAIIIFMMRKRPLNGQKFKSQLKTVLLFLLIGLSGSLPLMITLEQRRFYLVPSLPYYAIALASWIVPSVAFLVQQLDLKSKFYSIIKTISILFLAGSIIFSFTKIGQTRRDDAMLHDVYKMGEIIPAKSDINIDPFLWDHWSLQLYFNRHYNITLDPDTNHYHPYFLIPNDSIVQHEKKYAEVKIGLKEYRLFKLLD